MEATVFLGTFNAGDIFWYPSPDLCLNIILSRSSTDNSFDLMAWSFLWHALSTVGPYIDRCVPFQSIGFTTGALQWSCRNISRMINGNRKHLSSISSLIAKGLNTYVNVTNCGKSEGVWKLSECTLLLFTMKMTPKWHNTLFTINSYWAQNNLKHNQNKQQYIEFTTGEYQSVVKTSQGWSMETGSTWAQFWVS